MQGIVNKINILLQEIHDIKLQKIRNNKINVHKIHPKDTDEGNGQGDTHLIYNSASTHLLPYKSHTLGHYDPDPTHTPNTGHNAFAQQKPNLYKLLSTSPPESPSSSLSNEDSKGNISECARYCQMKTGQPWKRVAMGAGVWVTAGEREMRGGMEEGCPGPSSGTVTKPLDPAPDPESGYQ